MREQGNAELYAANVRALMLRNSNFDSDKIIRKSSKKVASTIINNDYSYPQQLSASECQLEDKFKLHEAILSGKLSWKMSRKDFIENGLQLLNKEEN